LITTTEKEFGIVGIQTDDTLILGLQEFNMLEEEELTKAKFTAKPKELLLIDTLLIFNKYILIQKEGNIKL
jgi:hypothetical protein